MKRVKRLAVLIMVAVMLLSGCGGDKAKPDGVYERNGISLDFSGDRVVITEGGVSGSYRYTIDKDGNMVIDPKGEEISARYDAETDTVIAGNIKYRKRATGTER